MLENIFRHRLVSTGLSSNDIGNCEVCGKHCTEVFSLLEERHYHIHATEFHGKYSGWTKHGAKDYNGHKECLEQKITEREVVYA